MSLSLSGGKEAGEIDYANKEIAWTVTVNMDKRPMKLENYETEITETDEGFTITNTREPGDKLVQTSNNLIGLSALGLVLLIVGGVLLRIHRRFQVNYKE